LFRTPRQSVLSVGVQFSFSNRGGDLLQPPVMNSFKAAVAQNGLFGLMQSASSYFDEFT
jgi:hypothetical protein